MKTLFLICLTMVSLSLFAESSQKTSCSNTNKVFGDKLIARRGCCSWHGGVCGCSYGRARCCDGTLSPSCGCD